MNNDRCVAQHWFRLSDRSLISQATPFADDARETIIVRFEEQTRKSFLHCSQQSRKFQHVTCVLGGLAWASAEQWHLIGDTKPQVREKVVQLKPD